MRKLLVALIVLLAAQAGAVDFKATTDVIGFSAQIADSTKAAGYLIPDSVRIIVTKHGLECLDAWYNAGSAQADSSNGILTWYDEIADIDADSGAGLYTVVGKFYNTANNLYYNRYYEFYLGTPNVNVASVSDDAINLATDVTSILADSNVASITVAQVDISTAGIATLAASEFITAASIAPDAIGASELAASCITASEIATGAIDADAIADAAIDGGALATDCITSSQIATGAIGAAEIADNAIDAGAIATDAITASKIAADAITSSEIASDAIGSAELAASCITNSEIATNAIGADQIAEDAIGTSELAQGAVDSNTVSATAPWDIMNFSLAGWGDSTATKVGAVVRIGCDTSLYGYVEDFFLVDSIFVDTNSVGTWMKNNVGTASSNWSDVQRDSVISALARLDDPLAVNMTQISGDGTAADNLENILDGTGTASVAMAKLTVSGANGAGGSVVITNSTGAGLVATGTTAGITATGSAGNGATFTGGTNGHGVAAVGAGTGEGLSATGGGTAGHGAQFIAGTAGTGLYLLGSTTGAGLDVYGGTSANGANIASGSAAANDGLSITGNDDGVVMTGGTAGNGLQIAGGSGILDVNVVFDSANFESGTFDSAHFTDKFFTNAQGAASGLDSAKVGGAVIAALNQDTTMHFKQIIVKSNGVANDSGAVGIYNTSSSSGDHALALVGNAGNAAYNYSASNSAWRFTTAGGSNPTFWIANTGSLGEAFKAEITGATNPNQAVEFANSGVGSGFKVTADDSAAAMQVYNSGTGYSTPILGAGEGMLVVSERGNAVTYQAGGTQAAQGNYGFQVEGTTYWHGRDGSNEDAVQYVGTGTGLGAYFQSVAGTRGIRISGAAVDTPIYAPGVTYTQLDTLLKGGGTGSETDTTTMKVMFANNPDLIGADTTTMKTMATNNPALFYGPSGSGSGTGAYSVVIYALDTSGTDQAIEGVKVTAQDASGGTVAVDWTNGSGYVTFALDADVAGASHTILARKTGYLWPNKSLTISGNVDSTGIGGYDIVLSDAGAECCNVYGYIFDANDQPLAGVVVQANKVVSYVGVDTTNAKSKILASLPITAKTDTTGLFQLFLRKTTDYADSTKGFYNIIASYDATSIFEVKKFYVPDAAYVDLGDTLLTRGD